jgi:multiple sugar transport system permease protein
MASAMAGTTGTPTRTSDEAIPVYKQPTVTWAGVRKYIGIVAIVIFCLGPFYWMIVMAFRDVGYTFDNSL